MELSAQSQRWQGQRSSYSWEQSALEHIKSHMPDAEPYRAWQTFTSTSLALDDADEILAEYSRYCSHSGQPGVGDEFFRWAFDNQYTGCQRVPLTPHEDCGYEEFPEARELAKFDRSDRKFVATALGCTPTASIYNAVDSDWSHSALALAAVGVTVAELCPDCLKPGRSKS